MIKKYPLGHAIIEWKDGGHSEAVFFQDREGVQYFVCGNWTSGPTLVKEREHWFENVITDHDDIYYFLLEKEYE
ncbi:hypothetical protein AU156_gp296 [Edwardsiella phage PEi20]|uniref:Uncharacterized protein n=2 Tax=Kanagawavirus pei20 TaxID=2844109 RepID=A0A0B6VLK5_9CAUD|nr:hypothetical protein AU156_gp296 [Edwardsiella phage PEi20]BAQ22804.1 conserved hypothetical protein [Edwardsiella phage PEi20]BAQ23107.1 conserved hypothetical protein [Edwardsiella phage PEi26]